MIFTLKGRITTGVGMSLVIISFFYWGFYNPQVKLVERTKREIGRENLRIVHIKEEINEYEGLKEEYQIMKAELSFLEDQLLKREEISSFFSELSLKREAGDIKYVEIIPEKVIPGEYYDRVPVRIQLYSTYHALGKFLSDIARRPKMGSLTVESIEMKGIESKKASSSKREKNYTIEVNLSMFVYSKKPISEEAVVKEEQNRKESLEVEKGMKVNIQRERVQSRRR